MATARYRAAVRSPATGEVPVALLTIEHAGLAAPIRLADNDEPIMRGGIVYEAAPMRLSLPRDGLTGAVTGSARIPDPGRAYGNALRALSSPPTLRIEIVLASTPEAVEERYERLEIRNSDAAAGGVLAIAFGHDDLRREPFPAHTVGPESFPGAY